ncbi:MAG: GMP synthase subunit A [Euryarchaeota archaeon]|nr:GMP synthase subunit A [Euryarchaeota archaeon]
MYLVIANRGQYNHRIYRTLRYLGREVKLVQNTLTPEEVEEMEPTGIVVGGGPFLQESGNSGEIISRLAGSVPILGICLGHQLIARVFGGEVREAEVGEYAEEEIIVDEEDEILRGLAPSFTAWVSHRDEVSKLPPGFVRLAHSASCEIEAMAHESLPVYGVQFHPEVAHTPRGSEVFRNFIEVCER